MAGKLQAMADTLSRKPVTKVPPPAQGGGKTPRLVGPPAQSGKTPGLIGPPATQGKNPGKVPPPTPAGGAGLPGGFSMLKR